MIDLTHELTAWLRSTDARTLMKEIVAEAVQNELKDGLTKVHEPLSQVVAEVKAPVPAESAQALESTEAPEEPGASVQAELPLGEPPEKPAGGSPHDHT